MVNQCRVGRLNTGLQSCGEERRWMINDPSGWMAQEQDRNRGLVLLGTTAKKLSQLSINVR
jgi:hypothetical protein